MFNKKTKRTIDFIVFGMFTILAYQSIHAHEMGYAMFYTLVASAIAAAVVAETE